MNMAKLTDIFRHVVGLQTNVQASWLNTAGRGVWAAFCGISPQYQQHRLRVTPSIAQPDGAILRRARQSRLVSRAARRKRYQQEVGQAAPKRIDGRGRITRRHRPNSTADPEPPRLPIPRQLCTTRSNPEIRPAHHLGAGTSEPVDQATAAVDQSSTGLREQLWKDYIAARDRLEQHVDSKTYDKQLEGHRQGKDPGIPGWEPSWSKEAFDLAHLIHAMKLTRALIDAQEVLDEIVAVYGQQDMTAAEWQDQDFPRKGSRDIPEAEVRVLLASTTPREAVQDWLNNIPSRQTEFIGSDKVEERPHGADSGIGMYTVEYLDHLQMSMDWSRDIETFDSKSCLIRGDIAEDKRAIRIKQVQERQHQIPPSWTWNQDFSDCIAPDHSKLLMSHMC